MIFKVAKTLREHWKKSIFFTGAALYGAKYLKDLHRDSLIRVQYCREAREYGIQPIKDGQRVRKVTVFLNPAAQNGKARKLFEKNVAPLLFLAGLQVTTVKTEHQGQAKRYMEVVEDTDAIIVAGGDGTLGEVITGILRRPDQERFSKIPIGIIPVGTTNTLANNIYKQGESVVQWMGALGMAIVKQTTRPIDVMQIKGNQGQLVFAVNSFNWGEYQDCEDRKKKYWFTGPLKHRLTYIMSTFTSRWPPNKRGDLAVGQVCSGCSRCYVPPTAAQKKWYSGVTAPQKQVIPDYATRDNPDCGVLHPQSLGAIEIQAQTRNDTLHVQPERTLKLYKGPETISKTDFIKQGWRRMNDPQCHDEDTTLIEAQRFTLTPRVPKDSDVMFSIDNEHYEAMPIEVTLLKNKLNILCPPTS